jgi:hypothetical protein
MAAADFQTTGCDRYRQLQIAKRPNQCRLRGKKQRCIVGGTPVSSAATDPTVQLDEQPLAGRQRYAAILVACGEFIDGYDLLVMGAALILIRPQFNLTPQALGLLGAAAFLGAMVGLLVFGDLSDRLGRRAICGLRGRLGVCHDDVATFRREVFRRRRRRHGHSNLNRLPRRDRPAPAARRDAGVIAQHHVDAGRDDLDLDRIAASRGFW